MSKIKVNTIAPRSGTTVTLGEAGDTIALGACASQTGFGQASSSVLFCTTAKTSPFTAEAGKGYFVILVEVQLQLHYQLLHQQETLLK